MSSLLAIKKKNDKCQQSEKIKTKKKANMLISAAKVTAQFPAGATCACFDPLIPISTANPAPLVSNPGGGGLGTAL